MLVEGNSFPRCLIDKRNISQITHKLASVDRLSNGGRHTAGSSRAAVTHVIMESMRHGIHSVDDSLNGSKGNGFAKIVGTTRCLTNVRPLHLTFENIRQIPVLVC